MENKSKMKQLIYLSILFFVCLSCNSKNGEYSKKQTIKWEKHYLGDTIILKTTNNGSLTRNFILDTFENVEFLFSKSNGFSRDCLGCNVIEEFYFIARKIGKEQVFIYKCNMSNNDSLFYSKNKPKKFQLNYVLIQ